MFVGSRREKKTPFDANGMWETFGVFILSIWMFVFVLFSGVSSYFILFSNYETYYRTLSTLKHSRLNKKWINVTKFLKILLSLILLLFDENISCRKWNFYLNFIFDVKLTPNSFFSSDLILQRWTLKFDQGVR